MRLGWDVRKLADGGIGTYVRELLAALVRLAPGLRVVAFGFPGQAERLGLGGIEWVDVRAPKYSLAEHLTLPAAVRARRLDLFHAPHYVLPLGLGCPAVVTVHDAIHVLLPRTPLHRLYGRFMIRSACRRARRVIAVSETTARDLRERLGVPGEKIRVVRNGVGVRFRRLPAEVVRARLSGLGLEDPYVLFVGNALPHKDVPTLVRAWARLPEPRPELVLCGGGYERFRAVRRAIERAQGLGRIRRLGILDEELLAALYNGAAVFVTASRYEGFGLPLLEAMACGTPVVATEAGALPEVAAGAALFVPPQRVDLLAEGMYRLLRDPDLRSRLVAEGLRRAASFSWEETARQTLAVYEEATFAHP